MVRRSAGQVYRSWRQRSDLGRSDSSVPGRSGDPPSRRRCPE